MQWAKFEKLDLKVIEPCGDPEITRAALAGATKCSTDAVCEPSAAMKHSAQALNTSGINCQARQFAPCLGHLAALEIMKQCCDVLHN